MICSEPSFETHMGWDEMQCMISEYFDMNQYSYCLATVEPKVMNSLLGNFVPLREAPSRETLFPLAEAPSRESKIPLYESLAILTVSGWKSSFVLDITFYKQTSIGYLLAFKRHSGDGYYVFKIFNELQTKLQSKK